MKKRISLILALVMAVCLLSACTSNPPQKSSNSPNSNSGDSVPGTSLAEPVHVGVLAPLTGSMAEYGTTFEVAMKMKAEEINAAGGINGRELVLEIADSKGDQNQSAELASRFAEDDKIVAILGDFTSGCSMAAAPVCDEAGIVLLAPTGSNAAFAPMSDYAFSISGRASAESSYAAQYAIKKLYQ